MKNNETVPVVTVGVKTHVAELYLCDASKDSTSYAISFEAQCPYLISFHCTLNVAAAFSNGIVTLTGLLPVTKDVDTRLPSPAYNLYVSPPFELYAPDNVKDL